MARDSTRSKGTSQLMNLAAKAGSRGWPIARRPALLAILGGGLCLLGAFVAYTPLGRPALALDATRYDFGEVTSQKELIHRFEVTNRGRRPLIIGHIRPCCGADAELRGGPIILAGETRTLEVRARSQVKVGFDERIIDLETNDPYRRRVSLQISWRAVPAILAVPHDLYLGSMLRQGARSQIVDLLNVPRGVRILGLHASSAALRPQLVGLPKEAAYRRIRITVWPAGLQVGEFRSEVRVSLNDPVVSSLTIPVSATILDDYEIQPPGLFLGFVGTKSHAVAQSTILVRNERAAPIRLLHARSSRFRVTLKKGSAHSYRLAVKPRGSLPSGRIADMVELAAGGRTLRIPLSGQVDPALD